MHVTLVVVVCNVFVTNFRVAQIQSIWRNASYFVERLTHWRFDMMSNDEERVGLPFKTFHSDANAFSSKAQLFACKLAPTTLQG